MTPRPLGSRDYSPVRISPLWSLTPSYPATSQIDHAPRLRGGGPYLGPMKSGESSKKKETQIYNRGGKPTCAYTICVLSVKEAMLGTLAHIRTEYGSVEQCVVDLGILAPEGIAQLRKNLIVEADEDELVQWRQHSNLMLQQDATNNT
ncbi:hypothetical protein GGR51DRAFT_184196 [Nemania sp. FL0031]|nr:hypothetical protein GGR51DRAFT_184196 [Nemania sp. FL0031]